MSINFGGFVALTNDSKMIPFSVLIEKLCQFHLLFHFSKLAFELLVPLNKSNI